VVAVSAVAGIAEDESNPPPRHNRNTGRLLFAIGEDFTFPKLRLPLGDPQHQGVKLSARLCLVDELTCLHLDIAPIFMGKRLIGPVFSGIEDRLSHEADEKIAGQKVAST
jgi:hypothetical protein